MLQLVTSWVWWLWSSDVPLLFWTDSLTSYGPPTFLLEIVFWKEGTFILQWLRLHFIFFQDIAARFNTLGFYYGFIHDVETFKDNEVVTRKRISMIHVDTDDTVRRFPYSAGCPKDVHFKSPHPNRIPIRNGFKMDIRRICDMGREIDMERLHPINIPQRTWKRLCGMQSVYYKYYILL